MSNKTPMMQQYFDIKEKYQNHLLFFRMGDFYEMFFDDAVEAARVLDITLTKRGKEKPIPMCGVPAHAYQSYLEKLIKNGYRVAICDQLESPEQAKKDRGYKAVVKRDVVRVVTAGTITEENLLSSKNDNFLLSITEKKEILALSWCDISTGKFFVTNCKISELETKISIINPQEIIIDDNVLLNKANDFLLEEYQEKLVNFPASYFSCQKAKETIKDFYQVKFIDSVAENMEETEISAIGALLSYLKTTGVEQLPKIGFPKKSSNKNILQIDKTTFKSLEIFSSSDGKNSLINHIDFTQTPSGARLLRNIIAEPLFDITKINQRLDKIELLLQNTDILTELRIYLKNFADLERFFNKLLMARGGARDMLAIINCLKIAQNIFFFYQNNREKLAIFRQLLQPLDGLENLIKDLDIIVDSPAILLRDGNFIKNNINEKLDYFRNLKNNAKDKVKELEDKYREKTGISNLKIKATPVLGYYIDINPNYMSKMDDSFFIHRQTLASSIRYVTEELIILQKNIFSADNDAITIENEIFNNLLKTLDDNAKKIKQVIISISFLDVFVAATYMAKKHKLARAELNNSQDIKIEEAFHFVVKNNMSGAEFVANDLDLRDGQKFAFITGPNMAGKSTFLRQNAIIILLAQAGLFVPAKKATIGLVDKIFSRVGASDDLAKGRSTFMVEMLETATILNNASEKSFLILDEVGRGTATFDGISIAYAISEFLHNKINARVLFASHYHELVELEKKLKNFACFYAKVTEQEDKIYFSHKIIKGVATKSYGISVASLAGFPKEVIDNAKKIMKMVSKDKDLQESIQLSLFDNFADYTDKAVNDNIATRNEKDIFREDLCQKLKELDIDNMSAKESLDILYKYQEELMAI